MALDPKLREILEAHAKREAWSDDPQFNPCEYSGGNYDDAYYGGVDDGCTILACRILQDFGS